MPAEALPSLPLRSSGGNQPVLPQAARGTSSDAGGLSHRLRRSTSSAGSSPQPAAVKLSSSSAFQQVVRSRRRQRKNPNRSISISGRIISLFRSLRPDRFLTSCDVDPAPLGRQHRVAQPQPRLGARAGHCRANRPANGPRVAAFEPAGSAGGRRAALCWHSARQSHSVAHRRACPLPLAPRADCFLLRRRRPGRPPGVYLFVSLARCPSLSLLAAVVRRLRKLAAEALLLVAAPAVAFAIAIAVSVAAQTLNGCSDSLESVVRLGCLLKK